MKNYVEITVQLEGHDPVSVRAPLPDLSEYRGKMSAYSAIEPRLWGLCERVADVLASRGVISGAQGTIVRGPDSRLVLPEGTDKQDNGWVLSSVRRSVQRGDRVMATLRVKIESSGASCGQCDYRQFRTCRLFNYERIWFLGRHGGGALVPMRVQECLAAEVVEPSPGSVLGEK
jgi:hypothetical protein